MRHPRYPSRSIPRRPADPRRAMSFCLLLAAILCAAPSPQPARAATKKIPDLQFAEVDGQELHLDLYLPEGVKNPPLVVYIHGGGWRGGSHKKPAWFFDPILAAGYAIASVEYRLSQVAAFPAQVHDCKGAVRWLRARADQYGYDASRIVATGGSAGGHLALMMGLTGGNQQLEGTVGGNLDQSSRVAAVVDFYGPTDFLLRAKDQPEQTDRPGGKVYRLLGGPVGKNPDLARLASPAFHVTPDDPPILAFHGTTDRKVLINQSERLLDACKQAGVSIDLARVEGAGHGDSNRKTPEPGTGETRYFNTRANSQRIVEFLNAQVKNAAK